MKKLVLAVLMLSFSLSGCRHLIQSDFEESRTIIDQSHDNENLSLEGNHGKLIEDKSLSLYQEFIDGNLVVDGVIDINELSIPTGEPNRRNYTEYAIFDSNGDEIPELHVRGVRNYLILMIQNNELVLWKQFFPNPIYYAIDNGAFMTYGTGSETSYSYIIFDYLGNEIYRIGFSKYYNAQIQDMEYNFDGFIVTKELWESLTSRYLYTDENGVERIRNEIEWTVLFDGTENITEDE